MFRIIKVFASSSGQGLFRPDISLKFCPLNVNKILRILRCPHKNETNLDSARYLTYANSNSLHEQKYFGSLLASMENYKGSDVQHNLDKYDDMVHSDSEIKLITKEDVVLFMFKRITSKKMRNQTIDIVLKKIEEHSLDYNIDELAIICAGLSGSQLKLTDNLAILIAKSMSLVDVSVNSYVINAMAKCLSHSTDQSTRNNPQFFKVTYDAMQQLSDLLPVIPISTVASLFHMYGSLRMISSKFLNSLCNVVLERKNDIKNSCSEDIGKIAFNFGYFSLRNLDVYNMLISELKSNERKEEIYSNPNYFLDLLLGLSYVDIYDKDLTKIVLCQEFYNLLPENNENDCRKKFFEFYENYSIDNSDDIVPNDIFDRAELMASYSDDDQKSDDSLRKNVLDLLSQALTKTLYSRNIYRWPLLPHYSTSDFLVLFDENYRPVEISDMKSHICSGSQFKSEQIPAKHIRTAFVVHGPMSYALLMDDYGVRNRLKVGSYATKVRLLSRLGFSVIEIPFNEFISIRRRGAYIEEKLRDTLKKHKTRREQ